MPEPPSYQRFFADLKRRKVFRVAAVYGATAFVVLQAVELLGEGLALPPVVLRSLTVFILAGFPIALVLAWAFETTPEGVRRTDPAASGELEAITAQPAARRWPSGLLGLAGFVALAIGVWLSLSSQREGGGAPVAPAGARGRAMEGAAAGAGSDDRRAVAVLPFAALTEDEGSRSFALGIHDDLLTQLSRIEGLRVTSRTSVMTYAGSDKPAGEIARELGVGSLVEGGVRTAAGRMRLNVQLIAPATDEHLWAETFDRELTAENVFAVQAEIARAVAGALRAELSPEEGAALAAALTDDLEAWNAYHRGRSLYERSGDIETDRAVVEEYRRATELDPEFVEAWAGLVRAQAWLIRQGNETDTTDAARSLARLRELAPEAPVTRLAAGYYRYYAQADFEGALPELTAARELAPGSADAHQYAGYVLRRLGRFDESNAALEEAARLDPRNPTVLWNLAINYRFQRRFDEAARRFTESLAVLPENDRARLFWFDNELLGRGDVEAAARIALDSAGFERSDAAAVARAWLALYRRDFDAAIDAVRPATGEYVGFPTSATANLEGSRFYLLALASRGAGDSAAARAWSDSLVAEARAEVEARTVSSGVDRFGRAAVAHALLGLGLALRGAPGDAAEAVRHGEEAVRLWGPELDAVDGSAQEKQRLRIHLLLGREREALAIIEGLLSRPAELAAGELRLDPIYDPLRGAARFEALLERAEALESR